MGINRFLKIQSARREQRDGGEKGRGREEKGVKKEEKGGGGRRRGREEEGEGGEGREERGKSGQLHTDSQD